MTLETESISKSEIFGRKIIDHQKILGGTVKPCEECPMKDPEILCGNPEGIKFNTNGKPECPMQPGIAVRLIIT